VSKRRPSDPNRAAAGRSSVPSGPQVLVPDACVGLKWFVPEPDADSAARLLDVRVELHVPSYFFVEAASVLQKKVVVERSLSEAEGLAVLDLLRKVPITIHPTESLLEEAFRHGVRYRRPVYDSLYMVLAQAINGRLVTADRRLYNGVHGGPLDQLVLWVTDDLTLPK
jgi:predicted nucleic acid-binding protein